MKGEYTLTNVRSVLPKAVGDSIEEGVRAFGNEFPDLTERMHCSVALKAVLLPL